jgi:hypothetical protein
VERRRPASIGMATFGRINDPDDPVTGNIAALTHDLP